LAKAELFACATDVRVGGGGGRDRQRRVNAKLWRQKPSRDSRVSKGQLSHGYRILSQQFESGSISWTKSAGGPHRGNFENGVLAMRSQWVRRLVIPDRGPSSFLGPGRDHRLPKFPRRPGSSTRKAPALALGLSSSSSRRRLLGGPVGTNNGPCSRAMAAISVFRSGALLAFSS